MCPSHPKVQEQKNRPTPRKFMDELRCRHWTTNYTSHVGRENTTVWEVKGWVCTDEAGRWGGKILRQLIRAEPTHNSLGSGREAAEGQQKVHSRQTKRSRTEIWKHHASSRNIKDEQDGEGRLNSFPTSCCNKSPQTQGLKITEITLLKFWRPAVRNQSVNKVLPFGGSEGKSLLYLS